MEKNTNSVTENSAWLTELTEREMESTTGGLLTRQQLSGWLRSSKAGTSNAFSVYNTLLTEPRADKQANILVAYKWFGSLTPNNKNIARGFYKNARRILRTGLPG